MKKLFLIFIIFSKTSKCYVQENYGSLHSNYMPSNSVLVNPSSMLDAKTRLEIKSIKNIIFTIELTFKVQVLFSVRVIMLLELA